jgi:hypothetical protein
MKVQITHKDIMSMVSEAINRLGSRRLLSEITATDAYTRFYEGKINPVVYQTLMSGTTNMTPFHKIALDFLTDKETAKGYIIREGDFAKTIGDLWCKLGPEGRQFLVKSCTNDPDLGKSYGEFSYLIRSAAGMKMFSEKGYRSGGLEVLFKTEGLSVTCTKSYSSSCHFYGKSHWCTASDMFGRYDGHEMFKEYTIQSWDGKGILVQFFNGKENSYQMQYLVSDNGNVKEGQCCNWEDSNADTENINNMLVTYGVTYDEIFNNYIKPNAARLAKETEELCKDEDIYYYRKKTERLKKVFGAIDANTDCKKADEFAKTAALESEQTRFEDSDGLYTCWVTRKDNTNGRILVCLRYNGSSESEKGMIQQFYEDYDDTFSERYGRVPNNYMVYAFNPDGTLFNKWRGEVSNTTGKLMFITEGYSEELMDVNLVAIVNAETFETIVDHPYNYCYIDDCEWVIDRNLDSFFEAYSEEHDGEMIDEYDIDRNAWYVCQPTGENYKTDMYLAINYETLEQIYFQA